MGTEATLTPEHYRAFNEQMEKGNYPRHSPEANLEAFRMYWNNRLREVGQDQVNTEYAACNSHWVAYIAGCKENARLAAAFPKVRMKTRRAA